MRHATLRFRTIPPLDGYQKPTRRLLCGQSIACCDIQRQRQKRKQGDRNELEPSRLDACCRENRETLSVFPSDHSFYFWLFQRLCCSWLTLCLPAPNAHSGPLLFSSIMCRSSSSSLLLSSDMGAAYGTTKAGCGIMISGISSPDLVYKNLIPIIMAGVNGMYVNP